MKEIIIINRVKCDICGDIICSKDIHDYKVCSCGNVSVDGGLDYLKRSAKSNDYYELSEKIKNNNDYTIVRNKYSQKDFDDCCCSCNSKNILLFKGEGEFINGLDFLGYECHDCKKLFVFKDINFK